MQYAEGKGTQMQMINALVKTQHKSAICSFWPRASNFKGVSWPPDPAFPSPWFRGDVLVHERITRVICDRAETPLSLSTILARPRSVMLVLVSGGAILDYRNGHSLTAVHSAVLRGNRDALMVILSHVSHNPIVSNSVWETNERTIGDTKSKSKKSKLNYFIVRPKVDQRAGQLSLPHLEIFFILSWFSAIRS